MVTISDIREEINDNESLTDERIQRTIDRAVGFIQSYTNNPDLPTNDVQLDDVIIYMVCQRLSPDTKYGMSAGKTGESVNGVSFSFESNLPLEIKMVLVKYKKVSVI